MTDHIPEADSSPQLPDEVIQAAANALLSDQYLDGIVQYDEQAWDIARSVTESVAAHFAKERDNLQAQNDDLLAVIDNAVNHLVASFQSAWGENAPLGKQLSHETVAILAERSGAADRLRAEGWEACASAFNGRLSIIEQPTNPFASSGDTTNRDK